MGELAIQDMGGSVLGESLLGRFRQGGDECVSLGTVGEAMDSTGEIAEERVDKG